MKLLHFTDSHLQLTPPPAGQFCVQPFWRGDARVLFERIGRTAASADTIVFTGDATHGGGAKEAAFFFDLLSKAAAGKLVFMVLGNHDVVNPSWRQSFVAQAARHPNITLADGIYPLGEVDLLLMHGGYLSAEKRVEAQWQPPMFPVPGLSDASVEQFNALLAGSGGRPVIAATHCPTHLLPPTPSAFADYVGPGMEAYRQKMHTLLDAHPRVRLVLSGHIHFNSTKIFENGRVHQSLASVAEYPCQVRMVEVTAGKVQTHLINLAAEGEFEVG